MTLNAAASNTQIDGAMSAVVLLNASCQAVIEAEIQGGSSPWSSQLDEELGAAEDLVLAWRRSGVLPFSSQVLNAIQQAGNAFTAAQPDIDALIAALESGPSADVQAKLVAALQALEPPVQAIVGETDDYLGKLKAFEASMLTAHENMQTTIAAVQLQEQQVQVQIASINTQIAALNAEIQTDRDAISKAQSQRTTGIVETIFGVVLTPFTGGASLILAGIGVASIAEAQAVISGMQDQISSFQQTVVGDQANLTSDQQVVATLSGLTMSTGIVLNDMDRIEAALDSLRTGWTAFAGELGDTINKLAKSATASDVLLAKVWYNAACGEWKVIVDHVSDLIGAGISTTKVSIG